MAHPSFSIRVQHHSSLLLCKAHHGEWVGPRAAVGGELDQDCWAALALGHVTLDPIEPMESAAIDLATHHRRLWQGWFYTSLADPQPLHRADQLIQSLDALFGSALVSTLPPMILAHLAQVPLGLMIQAHSHYYEEDGELLTEEETSVERLGWRWLSPQELGLERFAPAPGSPPMEAHQAEVENFKPVLPQAPIPWGVKPVTYGSRWRFRTGIGIYNSMQYLGGGWSLKKMQALA